jgi:hypothetical protein
MPIDQTKLGTVVQEQMEAIEEAHQEEDCELGDVIVLVEVLCPHKDQREVRVRSSPMSPHARSGLLAEALKTVSG